MQQDNNKFNFFVPLEITKGIGDSKEMKIKGICSSATEDSDGEILYPNGFNLIPLLSNGYLNYNHQAQKNAGAIIGEPTRAEVINNGKDLYIEGMLYPDSEEAKAVYKLATTLEKNSPSRRLGFSIEGRATQRDPLNPKRILAADITSVAITPCPKNPNTLLSIMKGDYDEPVMKSDSDDVGLTPTMDKAEHICPKCQHDNSGETKCKCIIDKAISTSTGDSGSGGLQVEDVDGGKKVMDSIINANRKIKKSEIYSQIIKSYPTVDFKKAEEIYSFIEQVNQKLFNDNMATTDKEILSEALTKAFEILDQQFDLIKSKVDESQIQPTTTQESINDLEKGKSSSIKDLAGDGVDNSEMYQLAKTRLEKGMSPSEAIESLLKIGVTLTAAQRSVDQIVSEMSNLPANGDRNTGSHEQPDDHENNPNDPKVQITTPIIPDFTLIAPIQKIMKSQTDELSSSFVELFKSQSEQIGTRFSGLGEILKSFVSENEILKKANDELQKSLDTTNTSLNSLLERVEKVEKTPIPTKTITTNQVVERFSKSQDASGDKVYSISNVQDRNTLSDIFMDQYEIEKSKSGNRGSNSTFAKAITDIDILHELQDETLVALQPQLRKLGIKIVK